MRVPSLAPAATPRPAPEPAAIAAPPVPGLSAEQKRLQQPLLAQTWSLAALGPRLPLVFPVAPSLPPSPKRSYRSAYRPPDPAARPAAASWASLSDFELALGLIDFSPLERLLATHYRPTAKGQTPFHPVSLFLCVCLRRELDLGWRALARLLAGAHGAGWRARFGFVDGQTPSASGLRYFFGVVGAEVFDGLGPQFVTLLRDHRLFPERSTYPGDPPERGITVSQDGMLHPARHRPSCQVTTDACYQPLPDPPTDRPAEPARPAEPMCAAAPALVPVAAGRRACRAREQGREGCACADSACQAQCQRASRLDPEARFIHYAGRTRERPAGGQARPATTTGAASPGRGGPSKGTDIFGYRSVAERVLDDRFAVAWTLRSTLYPANTDERTIFVERVQALQTTFPDLRIGEWLDDAGVGYGECLDALWQLGALRMVDIRADQTDADPAACVRRGYDGHGRPLCPHGYALRANGYDEQRRRAKYVCAQACRRDPVLEGEPVRPVADCPYLDPTRPTGFIVNVGRTLPDGSLRLAREIPYGSDAWQARYGRRNLSESRNGQLHGLGLKRMPAHGLERNQKEVQVGDFVVNLRTLGRLVRQASQPARS
jgi:hypothetical protein